MSENHFLTVEQVAERLQVSLAWIYTRCKDGTFPHTRIGGVIRIRENDLESYLTSHTNEPEPDKKAALG